jgi:hypothetical protein
LLGAECCAVAHAWLLQANNRECRVEFAILKMHSHHLNMLDMNLTGDLGQLEQQSRQIRRDRPESAGGIRRHHEG